MTRQKFEERLERYKSSSAPTEIKENAIKALLKEYNENATVKAHKQFQEQLPDYSDIK